MKPGLVNRSLASPDAASLLTSSNSNRAMSRRLRTDNSLIGNFGFIEQSCRESRTLGHELGIGKAFAGCRPATGGGLICYRSRIRESANRWRNPT